MDAPLSKGRLSVHHTRIETNKLGHLLDPKLLKTHPRTRKNLLL